MSQGYTLLHDLTIDVPSTITVPWLTDRLAELMASHFPNGSAVWWKEGDSCLSHGDGVPPSLACLPGTEPEHLCLMHQGHLLDQGFFAKEISPDWYFAPITDRHELFGWVGVEAAKDRPDTALLCTLGAIAGRLWRQQLLQDDAADRAARVARLSRFLSPELARTVADSETLNLGDRQATVLLFDLHGFTRRVYSQPHKQLLAELNEFFGRATQCIFAHKGVVDKLLGDGLLAVFGMLDSEPADPAGRAFAAALDLLEITERFNREFQPFRPFAISVGIASGEVHAGALGGGDFFDLTVIGKAVNLAARLETASRSLAVDIAMDDATYSQLHSTLSLTDFPSVALKGIPEPVRILGWNRQNPETAGNKS